jgi:steroid 5-alpha reductase family enzyme
LLSFIYFKLNPIISDINKISFLLQIIILIWGLRLGYRIHRKNTGKPEDKRYAAWRTEWSKKSKLYFFMRSYLQIYLLQAFIASIIILPAAYFIIYSNTLLVTSSTNNLSDIFLVLVMVFGFVIWLIGFLFEYFGDKQLDNFLRDKIKLEKEKIMTTGLWKFTRHPNYFGESSLWWGIYFISITPILHSILFPVNQNLDKNNFIILFILTMSPILITILLRFISGVPMLEKYWDNHPDQNTKNIWMEYKNKTPAMFPKFFK